MKKVKKFFPIVLAFVMLFALAGCQNEDDENTSKSRANNEVGDYKNSVEEEQTESNGQNPIATMKVEYVSSNGEQKEGTIKMELYPESAPITVANFVNLTNNKFYDGLTFHRIVENFMIQGGDPEGNGTGAATLSSLDKNVKKDSDEDYEYSIKGEFAKNNVDNNIKFEAGTLAMARSDYSSFGLTEEGYNSGCSQFFIMNTDNSATNESLQDQYAVFGKVIEGYDVVLEISKTEVKLQENGSEKSMPVNAPKIKSLEVETFGIEYKIPDVINAEETEGKVQKAYMELIQRMYGEQ